MFHLPFSSLTQISRWQPPLQLLIERKKLVAFDVLSESNRNLVLLGENSSYDQSVFKMAPASGSLEYEVICLSEISHPNIISLRGGTLLNDYFVIELEKARGSCLIDIILEEGKIVEPIAQKIFRQLASAVSFLHACGWVHRDLKPDNIMWDKNSGKLKLIDFESACRFRKGAKINQVVGTLRYLSPEVRRGSYEGPEIESWSLGVTLFVMLSAHFPFTDEMVVPESEFHKDLTLSFSSREANSLIKQLLEPDAKKRLAVGHIQFHPWMKRQDQVIKSPSEPPKSTIEKVIDRLHQMKFSIK